jgi:chaperone required for assembly of F1-ATPase
MRDIFDDIYKNTPLDPEEAVRRNTRVDLRKRFYETTGTDKSDGTFRVLLDGKPVRTPARRVLAVPSQILAQAIAQEWDAQQEVINPSKMPLTRLANSIIDGVADAPEPVAEDIEKYLGCDLLFYRADGPEGLIKAQQQHWDPIVSWARDELGARFILAEGVVFVPQAQEAITAACRALPLNPWALGALHSITTLTGSALLALALAAGKLDTDAAWAAAHVDEDFNLATWGRDEPALARRALRFSEMQAAARVLALAA